MPIEYNTALCPFFKLPNDLRQKYSRVATQVYPLRADLNAVNNFLSEYLVAENPFIHFEPLAPIILMQVCQYPHAESESPHDPGFPHRWFAQHEVAFGIPVTCFEGKERRFKEIAMVYPFIFVDNALSMAGGRQVYGWAKAGIEFDKTPPEFRPNQPRRVLSVHINPFVTPPELMRYGVSPASGISTPYKQLVARLRTADTSSQLGRILASDQLTKMHLDELHKLVQSDRNFADLIAAGARALKESDDNGEDSPKKTPDTFLQVFQSRPFLSGRTGVTQAISSVPRALGGFFAAGASLLDTMGSLIGGYTPLRNAALGPDLMQLASDIQSVGRVVTQLYSYMNALLPAFVTMTLGPSDKSGPTGGSDIAIYTVKQVSDVSDKAQHEFCYQAVIRSQMTIDNSNDGGLLFDPLSGDATGGIEIRLSNPELSDLINLLAVPRQTPEGEISLRPVMPFWADLDLTYGLADNQWWRTKHTPGWQPTRSDLPASGRLSGAAGDPRPITSKRFGSGAKLQLTGPRNADDAVMHFFQLQARQQALQSLIDRYLNHDSNSTRKNPFDFKVKTSYVSVTLFSYDNINVGSLMLGTDRVLTFSILADYYPRREDREHHYPCVIPLYNFVGTDWNFITEYEAYGRLTFRCEFMSPEDAWIKESGPAEKPHDVLRVRTTLFPHLEGKATNLDLFTISATEPSKQAYGDPKAKAFSDYLKELGMSDYFRVQDSTAESSFKTIALKQVRNAIQVDTADYQSLVGIDSSVTVKSSVFRQNANIAIAVFEGFPVLDEIKFQGANKRDNKVEIPCASFSIRAQWKYETAQELWQRVAADGEWTPV